MLVNGSSVLIGCAGWNLPAAVQDRFPTDGSHLERYAQQLPAVEINSSFYRPHRRATYQRWADNVPAHFRFSVKVPRRITHERRLADSDRELEEFLSTISGLGEKLGCLLIQLPPSLRFERCLVAGFLASLRSATETPVALEPRHVSWFSEAASALLIQHHVGRVAADPSPIAAVVEPSGWLGTVYFRLHGSPRIYYSSYPSAYLQKLASQLRAISKNSLTCWCIFDNTADGAAWQNALEMCDLQSQPQTW